MSSSHSLPRLGCSCLLQSTRSASASTSAFSTIHWRRQQRSSAPFSTAAVSFAHLNDKGKGKEVSVPGRRPLGAVALVYSPLRSTAGQRQLHNSQPRHSSSQSNPPRYAHESLLSLPERSTSAAQPTKGRLGFFSRSANAAKPTKPAQANTAAAEVLPPPSTSPLVPVHAPLPVALPPTKLSDGLPNPAIRWREQTQNSLAQDWTMYQQISKFRLSAFTVLTAMAGYALCPVDPSATTLAMEQLAASISGVPLSELTTLAGPSPSSSSTTLASANSLTLSAFLPMVVGTSLCAASAAAINQWLEAPYDAQMARTRNRPLPKRTMSPLHAASFATLTGTVGIGTLASLNLLTAGLGAFTIVLYAPFYTITKRHTIYNTWLGAVVGAVPPLIGWAACTGDISPLTQPGAWAVPLLMFFWQFPHFNSLAFTLRSSYASSGYRMLAVLDPAKNALVSLRYALAMVPLTIAMPAVGLTNWLFAYAAMIPNGLMVWTAIRFWRRREERRAKELFWASLVHLPVFLGLAMLCKTGLWGEEEKDEEKVEEEGEKRQV